MPHDQSYVELAGNLSAGAIGGRVLVSGAIGEKLRVDGQLLSLAMLDTEDSLGFASVRYNVLENDKLTLAPFLMAGGLYNHLYQEFVPMVSPGLSVNFRYKKLGLDGAMTPYFWLGDQDMDVIDKLIFSGGMSSFGASLYFGKNQLRAGYDATCFSFGYRYQGERFYVGASTALVGFIFPGAFVSGGFLW